MIESKISRDRNIVFRETFNSVTSVSENGGNIIGSNLEIRQGKGLFNGNSNIQYSNKLIIPLTYTIRLKVKFYDGSLSYGLWSNIEIDSYHQRNNCLIDLINNRYNIQSAASASTYNSTINFKINTWYEFVFTFNRNLSPNGKIYVNGKFDVNYSGNYSLVSPQMYIGSRSTSSYLLGEMEYFEVYNKIFSDSKISLLYKNRLYRENRTPIKKGIQGFFSNDKSYIDLGNHIECRIPNHELEIEFLEETVSEIFSMYYDQYTSGSAISSYAGSRHQIHIGGIKTDTNDKFYGKTKINLISLSGQSPSQKIIINNKTFKSFFNHTTIWNETSKFLIGAIDNDGNLLTNGKKCIFSFKYWELDSSGNRIKELINLDFNQQTGTNIPNLALDAPSGLTGATIVSNGQLTDSWWINYGEMKEVISYTINGLNVPNKDKYGNNVNNLNSTGNDIIKYGNNYVYKKDFNDSSVKRLEIDNFYFNYLDSTLIFWIQNLNKSGYHNRFFGHYQTYLKVNNSTGNMGSVNTPNGNLSFGPWTADGKFHNIIVFFTLTGTQVYFDGELNAESSLVNEWYFNGNITIFGSSNFSQNMKAYFKEFKLIKGTPTNKEEFVSQYYNSTKSKFGF